MSFDGKEYAGGVLTEALLQEISTRIKGSYGRPDRNTVLEAIAERRRLRNAEKRRRRKARK